MERAHLYTIVKVTREEDLFVQIGRDIYFDLVDHNKVFSFRIKKRMVFNHLKNEVAKEFGIPIQFQRFWLWAKRQNKTCRLCRRLTPQEEARPIGQLMKGTNEMQDGELNLFLEVKYVQGLWLIPPPVKSAEDILLFFKLYDPLKEELRYVGRLFVKAGGMPVEILAKLNELAGFAPDEDIELFEEIKFEPKVMCEPVDKMVTFRYSQLEDGDIICFQISPQAESSKHCRYPDVPSFLEYVHSLQVVRFRSLERPNEDEFCLELSKLHNYDDVVERVARHLALDDPSKIRLTDHNSYSQQPGPQPIKYRGVEHLSDILVRYNQTSDILYYEVLDIPLPELESLKTLKVVFHHSTKDEVVIHTIRLSKKCTVGDVINDLKTKIELSNPNAELRLLQVSCHKINKIFPLNEKIENLNDEYWTLRAEEIPQEEKNLGPHDLLIHVCHFKRQKVQNFGKPFFLVICEGEFLAEVKVRIQKKLQVADEEFSKWKFAFLSWGRPEYLQDTDIVSIPFQRKDVYGSWDHHLGLKHSDNGPTRSYAASQRKNVYGPWDHHLGLKLSENAPTRSYAANQRKDVYGSWDQHLGLKQSDNAPTRSYAANQKKETRRKIHKKIKLDHDSKHGCPYSSKPKPAKRGRGTISGGSTTQTQSANAPADKVRFLAYWVSSKASLLLERIHDVHKDNFTKFSMKGEELQTFLLESFASFVESLSTNKVNEVQEEVPRRATISIEDFEQIGLELSWLKKRLEDAKKVNKRVESLTYVDLCEAALKVGRAKVCELEAALKVDRAKVLDLEEGLVKAKAELENMSMDLPNSLGGDDFLLMDIV